MATMTARRPVVRISSGARTSRPDTLAVEEPLEIRLGDHPYTVTMRTPGHDLELALGLLLAEGVIHGPQDVRTAMHCPDAARDADGNPTHNVVEVTLAPTVPQPAGRSQRISSACGICGTESIDQVRTTSAFDLHGDTSWFDPELIADLPRRMRDGQRVFDRTGGLHAAGLFDRAGRLVCVREDVGRHNAVDKVVGWMLGSGLFPGRGHILQVSGRASFELVQKAWLAGVPALAAVSAPSSLAVDLAVEAGMTLVGFSRGGAFNVYAGLSRLEPVEAGATPAIPGRTRHRT